ncbi:cysteine desulfurase family protein [Oscillospiraceae bacterium MB08-C2-2]|nr:cysteine desulfurase family protein [Oscillospiraceae bacterium MB08-C2-2]
MAEIYLDNCATTRVDERVAQLMLDCMTRCYGNPSSLHPLGTQAALALEKAGQQVAKALGCREDEVLFTSGGTEANNLALLGAAEAMKRRGNKIVATAWEHSSILEPLRQLEQAGFAVTLISPEPDGHISPQKLAEAVNEQTILLSCMLVNSEVGAVAPIAEIARLAKAKNPRLLVHCDGVQGFGKLPFNVTKWGVDLVTVSGHKIHGPKGVGALYIRKGVRVLPRVFGGSQQKKLRPGTENMPGICGMGLAAELACANLEESFCHVTALKESFLENLKKIPGLCSNSPIDATPYIVNISVPGYRSETLLHFLGARGICVSSGSACSKGAKSHVLVSMGLPDAVIDNALRVSLCAHTTEEELNAFVSGLGEAVESLAGIKK